MNIYFSYFVTAVAIATPGLAFGSKAKDCKVLFATKGQPVLVKIEGKSEQGCEGTFSVQGSSLADAKFKLELNQLDTGIALRNKHLRENYLHVEKFPVATVTISEATGVAEHLAGKANGKSAFKGELELHGVKKPIQEGMFQVEGKKVTAEFAVDLPDHGIERPSFMGVKIVDKVYITVNFEIDG